MMDQLQEKAPGRPPKQAAPELAAMKEKIAKLEAQVKVAEQTAQVRAILMDMRKNQEKRGLKKKKPRSPRC
jgi:hypothetical protein